MLAAVKKREILAFGARFFCGLRFGDVWSSKKLGVFIGDPADVAVVELLRVERVEHGFVVGKGANGLERPVIGVSLEPPDGGESDGVGDEVERDPLAVEVTRCGPVTSLCRGGCIGLFEEEPQDLLDVVASSHRLREAARWLARRCLSS